MFEQVIIIHSIVYYTNSAIHNILRIAYHTSVSITDNIIIIIIIHRILCMAIDIMLTNRFFLISYTA